MTAMAEAPLSKRDPRHLRAMIDRAGALAREHRVPSVFVGIAGREGDLVAPEFIAFVESALRMEDAVFRMLRERAVLLLTDVDREGAETILSRLQADFASQFAPSAGLDLAVGFYELRAGANGAMAKEILPAIFQPSGEEDANGEGDGDVL
jgi:sulfite reductase beta subunit-like hemoprotein